MLGGNASLELGVGAQGASISLPNAIETGIIEEATRVHRLGGYHSLSPGFHQLCEAEPALTVFLNTGRGWKWLGRTGRRKPWIPTGDHSFISVPGRNDCTVTAGRLFAGAD